MPPTRLFGGEHVFSYDWVNPRFGRQVKEVRLHGTTRFLDTKGKPTPTNAIVLAGVSVVKKRPTPPAADTQPLSGGR